MPIMQAFPCLFLRSRQTLGYFLAGAIWWLLWWIGFSCGKWSMPLLAGIKNPQHISLGAHLPTNSTLSLWFSRRAMILLTPWNLITCHQSVCLNKKIIGTSLLFLSFKHWPGWHFHVYYFYLLSLVPLLYFMRTVTLGLNERFKLRFP